MIKHEFILGLRVARFAPEDLRDAAGGGTYLRGSICISSYSMAFLTELYQLETSCLANVYLYHKKHVGFARLCYETECFDLLPQRWSKMTSFFFLQRVAPRLRKESAIVGVWWGGGGWRVRIGLSE